MQQLQGITNSALQTTDTTARAGLATQYNSLLSQLDELVTDATFNGTNLLNASGNLTVYFNARNTTSLTISRLLKYPELISKIFEETKKSI